jgi:hypothetical protein
MTYIVYGLCYNSLEILCNEFFKKYAASTVPAVLKCICSFLLHVLELNLTGKALVQIYEQNYVLHEVSFSGEVAVKNSNFGGNKK